MNSFKDLIELIQNSSYILIAGHISPDGDAIGACAAMGHILKKMGKEYGILLDQPDPKYHYLLENVNILTHNPNLPCDLFISLDCADVERLGVFQEIFNASKISYNIDHHVSNTGYGDFNYVDARASSTSEIIFYIYKALKVTMDNLMAQAIYTGLVYDTSAFRHTNTSSSTLAVASELLQYQFNFSKIIQTLFYERSFEAIKLQGMAINNLKTYYDNSLVVSTLSLEEIKQYTNDTNQTEGIINIKGSKVALFLYEKNPGEIKISMRGEDSYDVCKIASFFGGGGHTKAAGATIYGTLYDAKEKVLPLLMGLFE